MKVTFLVPPPLDGGRVADRVAGCAYGLYPMPNVFELTAAAVAEREGHEVKYADFPIHGWGEAEFDSFIAKDASDVYCFYSVNLTRETDIAAAKKIRAARGNAAAVVFYGPSPTYFTDSFLLDERAYVVRGEPEATLVALLRMIGGGNAAETPAGVSRLRGGAAEHAPPRPLIEDIDTLPFPARHLLDRDLYYNPKLGLRPFTTAYASRNCPHRCLYCVPCSLSFARELEYKKHNEGKKPPIKLRSAENVAEEIQLLAKDGYRSLTFLDDQFLWGEDRTLAICDALKEAGIRWGCASRADKITERAIAAMAAAGCEFMDIGVESFDQRILDYVKKDLKVEDIVRAVGIVKKHGIRAKINILLGCSPLESKETIAENKRMVKILDVDQVMYNISNPFPGTEFYEIAKAEGWLTQGDYVPSDVQKEAIISLPLIKPDELVSEVRRANFEFFLNPRFILKNIRRFRTLNDWRDAVRSLIRKLF